MLNVLALLTVFFLPNAHVKADTPPKVGGCDIFPENSWWNTPIDQLPMHSESNAWITSIGRSTRLKADFGSGLWEGKKIGIPYVVVPSNQAKVPINYIWWPEESDAGPFPIPNNAPVEGGGDSHVIVIQQGTCQLYELYASTKLSGPGWSAGSGAKWNLSSNTFRPLGWTSADAAGLPVFPGLVRYDEIVNGEISHAIRFTVSSTRNVYNWPATHKASSATSTSLPPMGARFRLKADFDISGFSNDMKIILRALKKYGLILADNGSNWYMSGSPDERWNNDMLNNEFKRVLGEHMEAVDVSGLMISPQSGAVKTFSPKPSTMRPSAAPSIAKTKIPTRKPTKFPTRRRRKARNGKGKKKGL